MASGPLYNLLIATGRSPQVITETAFELNRVEDLRPASVHVITTRLGQAYGRAQLLGEPHEDPFTGSPIEHVEARWPVFCEKELGLPSSDGEDLPVDLTFHVPDDGGNPLEDIRKQGEDTLFANLCYKVVERLTREEELPLIGSIAGGRKTMSAHLMTAFSVYGRPEDRLTHVLLSDPSKEGSEFFYPETGSPRYGELLKLVDIRFPQVRTVLSEGLVDGMPEDRRNLEGVLDALAPHVASARSVDKVRVVLRDGGAELEFIGEESGDDPLDTCELTTKQVATLLVFAEQRAADGGPVPSTDLVYDALEAPIGRQRGAVQFLCSQMGGELDPWENTGNVSKAISDLSDGLRGVPVASRLLQVEGRSRSPTRYEWPDEPPVLQIATRYPSEDWPFEHLPELTKAEE